MNIRQVATGKGLGNVSNMARQVWAEFRQRPNEVGRIAAAIKSGIKIVGSQQLPDVELELPEGRLLTALHIRRERHPKVRKMLIDARGAGGLRCRPIATRLRDFDARGNVRSTSSGATC